MSAACPQLAFEVRFSVSGALDASAQHALARAFAEFLDASAMTSRGLPVSSGRSVMVWREGGQTTELDREAVRRWAAHRNDLAFVSVGALFDQLEQ